MSKQVNGQFTSEDEDMPPSLINLTVREAESFQISFSISNLSEIDQKLSQQFRIQLFVSSPTTEMRFCLDGNPFADMSLRSSPLTGKPTQNPNSTTQDETLADDSSSDNDDEANVPWITHSDVEDGYLGKNNSDSQDEFEQTNPFEIPRPLHTSYRCLPLFATSRRVAEQDQALGYTKSMADLKEKTRNVCRGNPYGGFNRWASCLHQQKYSQTLERARERASRERQRRRYEMRDRRLADEYCNLTENSDDDDDGNQSLSSFNSSSSDNSSDGDDEEIYEEYEKSCDSAESTELSESDTNESRTKS